MSYDDALIKAAERGELSKLLHRLDNGADPNASEIQTGDTPLLRACSGGHIDCVQALLERGAKPELAAADGETPLVAAVVFGDLDLVKLLLDQGAPIAQVGAHGTTPLHACCESDAIDIARLLLDKNAPFAAVDEEGLSPLHHAAERGCLSIAQLLLDKALTPNWPTTADSPPCIAPACTATPP